MTGQRRERERHCNMAEVEESSPPQLSREWRALPTTMSVWWERTRMRIRITTSPPPTRMDEHRFFIYFLRMLNAFLCVL